MVGLAPRREHGSLGVEVPQHRRVGAGPLRHHPSVVVWGAGPTGKASVTKVLDRGNSRRTIVHAASGVA